MRIRCDHVQWLVAAVCALLLIPVLEGQKKSAPAPTARSMAPTRPVSPPAGAANRNLPAANRPSSTRPSSGTIHTAGVHPGVSHPEGVHTAGGGTRVARHDGGSEFHGPHGEQARFDHAGHVREIRSGNMHIDHRPGGMRHIEMERADHSRMVIDSRGRGYVQRPYMFRGHAFYHRDYYVNGVRYSRFYRPYYYHTVYLTGYMPARYYPPAFYGWAYAPWGQPVAYAWGWGAAPWYGYYGPYYFAPSPVYASASLWLTDYLIAQSLQDAYQQGVAAGAAGYVARHDGDTPLHGSGGARLVYASYSPSGAWDQAPTGVGVTVLTPQIKQLIANEVQAELAANKTAAQNAGGDSASSTGSLAQLLNDGQAHVFVVSTDISAPSAGQECPLSEGDVLQSAGRPPATDGISVDLTILASKKKSCGKGSPVSVSLEDLQDMQNHLMATVDQGLDELSARAGKDGLPAAPPGVTAATDAPYASAAPASDPNVDQELAQGEQEANQAEQAVLSQAAPENGAAQVARANGAADASGTASPPGAPVTIALGQTPAQVTASKGAPKLVVNLGSKQIYVYSDMKIYFVGNKVSDVK